MRPKKIGRTVELTAAITVSCLCLCLSWDEKRTWPVRNLFPYFCNLPPAIHIDCVGLCLCAFVWETERDLPDWCEDFRYARLCPLLPPLARASTSRCHSHSSPRHVPRFPPDSMTSPSFHYCQLRSDCCCLSCSPCKPLSLSPPAPPYFTRH